MKRLTVHMSRIMLQVRVICVTSVDNLWWLGSVLFMYFCLLSESRMKLYLSSYFHLAEHTKLS